MLNLLKIWRNEKSREIIIQIIVLIIFGWFISWLAGNVSGNFERLGKDLSFEFLFIPAGYDINQYLISYNNRDSHLRAAIVGLLNTGLVAICGIVIATIFGLFLGVLRLSKNWLANRIAYWYVEFTRNVPVLLQIILYYSILLNLPKIKQAFVIFDTFYLTNRGLFSPSPIFKEGFSIVLWSFIFALIFSILLSITSGFITSPEVLNASFKSSKFFVIFIRSYH